MHLPGTHTNNGSYRSQEMKNETSTKATHCLRSDSTHTIDNTIGYCARDPVSTFRYFMAKRESRLHHVLDAHKLSQQYDCNRSGKMT